MNEERKVINISEVLHLMSIGYTRTPNVDGWGGKGYNPEIGSIQEHYELTDNSVLTAEAQVKALFQHPKLKKAKTKIPVVMPFTIVDDTTPTETATTTDNETVSGGQVVDNAVVTSNNEFERLA